MLFFTEEKITKLLAEIRPTIWRETHNITTFKFYEGDVKGAEHPDFDDSGWQDFKIGSFWGGYDIIAWFRTEVTIPAHLRDKKLALRFLVGPRDGGNSTAETLLYVNGTALQAIDIWHEEAWLPEEHLQGDSFSIALRSWSGVLGVPDRRRFKVAQLNWIDESTEEFYSVADTMLRAVKELDQNDWRRGRLLEILNSAFRKINFTKPCSEEYYRSIDTARLFLCDALAKLSQQEDHKPTVIPVGHAHIDMAWLWRLHHSREKAGRTFATVLHYMRQYPEYQFLHSSPQLYKYLENDYPELFERVKGRIAAGQWEITGAMWIEPDVNVPSGESLIRQIVYGKRYVREKFGKEMNVLWLPDVFGYNGALPQILKKSGVKYFMTSKISWSQFNRFPHDTFHWRGIDGTEILTHFITTPEDGSRSYTYNGTLTPRDVRGIWDNYQSKNINDELLMAYGWGDGGGGPTKEMIETARVMRNMPGFPRVELGKAEPFFERLEKRLEGKDVPVWDGELYLEYHRGTYTSQAQNKLANRKSEILYHDAEWMGALADVLTGENCYPDLSEGWELILLNQFHDILPGSSIRQVYEDSAIDYARVAAIGKAALDNAQSRIVQHLGAEKDSVAVFNSMSWTRKGLVEIPATDKFSPERDLVQAVGDKMLVYVEDVPEYGYAVAAPKRNSQFKEMVITPDHLENQWYDIRLNNRGQIVSLWDKTNKRQVMAKNAVGNVFQAFEDKPLNFDAWDIDLYYQEKMQEIDALVEAVVEEVGPLRATLRLQWCFYDSVITQRISIYQHSRRIDFRTEIDWHEQQVLLKVAFPVNIRATRATYDIQFGTVERPTHWNTSWDYARFEVCAHKWADLSEGNYGVALLNDCKYGYDIKGNVMRLTLLKSAIRPDAQADKGHHEFTYSLLPHAETWDKSQVIQEAYDLNFPMHSVFVPAQPQNRVPSSYSFVTSNTENVIVETVKQAEDGNGWVVRVYESRQCRDSEVSLCFGQPLRHAVECNMIEEEETSVAFIDNCVSFDIAPYEVKTFKVWF